MKKLILMDINRVNIMMKKKITKPNFDIDKIKSAVELYLF